MILRIVTPVIPALDPDDFSANPESANRHSGAAEVFTLEQANAMLPLVRSIAEDLARLTASVSTQRDQIRGIDELDHHGGGEQVDGESVYRAELDDVRSSIESDDRRIAECTAELEALGVSVPRPLDGSVDFPGRLGGRQVCWCWQPGESSIQHWHLPGQHVSKRRSIASVN